MRPERSGTLERAVPFSVHGNARSTDIQPAGACARGTQPRPFLCPSSVGAAAAGILVARTVACAHAVHRPFSSFPDLLPPCVVGVLSLFSPPFLFISSFIFIF